MTYSEQKDENLTNNAEPAIEVTQNTKNENELKKKKFQNKITGENMYSKNWLECMLPDLLIRKSFLQGFIIRDIIKRYFVALYMFWKKVITQLHNKADICLGMIGCGHIGTLLLDEILNLGVIEPSQIYISVRNPDKLRKFADRGVQVQQDSQKILEKCEVVAVLIQNHQVLQLKSEIDFDYLNRKPVLISFINGTKRNKLKNIFRYSQLICVEVDIQQVNQILDEQQHIGTVNEQGDQKSLHQTQSMFANQLLAKYNKDIINSLFKKDEFFRQTLECLELLVGVEQITDQNVSMATMENMKAFNSTKELNKEIEASNVKKRKQLWDQMLGQDCKEDGKQDQEIVSRIKDLMTDQLELQYKND